MALAYPPHKKEKLKYPKSPLRYPGGKARAVGIMLSLIPADIQTLVSPFFGGGSIEIAAAFKGIRVYGYDVFSPLVDFWKELLIDPAGLALQVEDYYPLSREKFYELQRCEFPDRLESAAVFYVLNRASFSGSTLSGGMSPGHPRFTPASIDYLRSFYCPCLSVDKQDFAETFKRHTIEFMYLDPPYLISSSLYGKKGNTHKDFDHFLLNDLLLKRKQWILSYNDSPDIRWLYRGFPYVKPNWKYGMSSDKDSRELIILSEDIAEKNGTIAERLR